MRTEMVSASSRPRYGLSPVLRPGSWAKVENGLISSGELKILTSNDSLFDLFLKNNLL
jgi:hypothetical protein